MATEAGKEVRGHLRCPQQCLYWNHAAPSDDREFVEGTPGIDTFQLVAVVKGRCAIPSRAAKESGCRCAQPAALSGDNAGRPPKFRDAHGRTGPE